MLILYTKQTLFLCICVCIHVHMNICMCICCMYILLYFHSYTNAGFLHICSVLVIYSMSNTNDVPIVTTLCASRHPMDISETVCLDVENCVLPESALTDNISHPVCVC